MCSWVLLKQIYDLPVWAMRPASFPAASPSLQMSRVHSTSWALCLTLPCRWSICFSLVTWVSPVPPHFKAVAAPLGTSTFFRILDLPVSQSRLFLAPFLVSSSLQPLDS